MNSKLGHYSAHGLWDSGQPPRDPRGISRVMPSFQDLWRISRRPTQAPAYIPPEVTQFGFRWQMITSRGCLRVWWHLFCSHTERRCRRTYVKRCSGLPSGFPARNAQNSRTTRGAGKSGTPVPPLCVSTRSSSYGSNGMDLDLFSDTVHPHEQARVV